MKIDYKNLILFIWYSIANPHCAVTESYYEFQGGRNGYNLKITARR